MADVFTSQILENGPRFIVAKFTGYFDAMSTDETGVVKIDATSTGPYGNIVQGQTFYPETHLAVSSIKYSVAACLLRIQWVATADTDMLVLQATDHWDFLNERNGFGGLVSSGIVGATGSIAFTTEGTGAGSGYTVIFTCTKNIPQR